MPHVLHLIKDPTNRAALDVITRQARDPAVRLSVVLVQEGVRLEEPLPGKVYRLEESQGADMPRHPSITHSDLLDLIFAADTVVAW